MPLEDLAEFIAENFPRGKVVELGIGFQTRVALKLKDLGYDVLAIDWNERAVGNARRKGIKAEKDDLFRPRLELYKNAVLLYSVRPTPEIMKPIVRLSDLVSVPLVILPLSGDSVPRGLRLINYRGLVVYVKGI